MSLMRMKSAILNIHKCVPSPLSRNVHLSALGYTFPKTSFTAKFGCQYPVVLGPMAGAGTPELCIAVMKAGGYGSLSTARLHPETIRQQIQQVRNATSSNQFAVNLFIPPRRFKDSYTELQRKKVEQIIADRIRTFILSEDVPFSAHPEPPVYEEQFKVLIEEKVDTFSFTFGCPSADDIEQCKATGLKLIGTATTLPEAEYLCRIGQCDALVLQGSEAGGHRGSFLVRDKEIVDFSTVGLHSLVSQCARYISSSVPLIAAGGIANGSTMASAMLLGASAAQIGTAFLTAEEPTLIHPAHKAMLLAPYYARKSKIPLDEQVGQGIIKATTLTRVFSGKPARGFVNSMTAAFQDSQDAILPWTIQDRFVQPYANYAKKHNHPEFMQMWTGQNYFFCEPKPAKDVLLDIIEDAASILNSSTRQ